MSYDTNVPNWRRQRLAEWKASPEGTPTRIVEHDDSSVAPEPTTATPHIDSSATIPTSLPRRNLTTADGHGPLPSTVSTRTIAAEGSTTTPMALILQELDMRRAREQVLERRLAEYDDDAAVRRRGESDGGEAIAEYRRKCERLTRALEEAMEKLKDRDAQIVELRRELGDARRAAAEAITTAAARLSELTATAAAAAASAPSQAQPRAAVVTSPVRRTLDTPRASVTAAAATTSEGPRAVPRGGDSAPRRSSPSLFPKEPPSLRRVPSPLGEKVRVPSPHGSAVGSGRLSSPQPRATRVPSPFNRRADSKTALSARGSDASRGGTTTGGAGGAVTAGSSVPRTSRPVITHGTPTVGASATRTVVTHVRAQETFRTPKFETAYRPSRLVRHFVWERAEDVAERAPTPHV